MMTLHDTEPTYERSGEVGEGRYVLVRHPGFVFGVRSQSGAIFERLRVPLIIAIDLWALLERHCLRRPMTERNDKRGMETSHLQRNFLTFALQAL